MPHGITKDARWESGIARRDPSVRTHAGPGGRNYWIDYRNRHHSQSSRSGIELNDRQC